MNGEVSRANLMKQDPTPSIYNPNHLLNTLIVRLGLASDGALSSRLRVARHVVANIRYGRLPVCASMLLWMQEASGMSIHELRRLMGDRRSTCRVSYAIDPKRPRGRSTERW